VMVTAAMMMVREAVDGRMLVDFVRGLVSGGATVLLLRALPPVAPFIGIPVCVLVFFCLATVFGLVNRQDFQLLATAFRKRTPDVVSIVDTLDSGTSVAPRPAVSPAVVDPLSGRLP
jgi:hypothetical protein